MKTKDIRRPRSMTFDKRDNAYVTDRDSRGIYMLDQKGALKDFISPDSLGSGSTLRGILCFSSGELCVSDPDNERLILASVESQKKTGEISLPAGSYPDSLLEHDGKIYISDPMSDRVMELDPNNRKITRIFGSSKELKAPRGMCAIGGKLLVADRDNDSIAIIDLVNGNLTHALSFGRGEGKLRKPTDVKIVGNTVFVNDGNNYLVQAFDTEFNFKYQVGGKGPKLGQLDLASYMCAYKDHLYICDRNNDRIVIYDPRNKKFSMFLPPVFEEGRLRRPFSATVDDNDNIYIADRDNDKVQIFDRKGAFKKTLGPFDRPSAILVRNKYIYVLERSGSGVSALCRINNGKREYAKFDPPLNHARDMAMDNKGTIYIADTYNRSIRKLAPNMTAAAIFDMREISGNSMVQIKGLTISEDTIFAADFDGFRIFKLNIDGQLIGTITLADKLKDADKLRSVSIVNGRIVACVRGENQVHLIDMDGSPIKSFGERGIGPYSFRNPTKAVRMNCGDILLVDKENDRIVRYNKDWKYISVIGND